jgi:AsmA-like protein
MARSAGQTLRLGVLVFAALAVVALVAPLFINVNRLKGRVTDSMSKAFGRAVTCDSISLRLLPQPGFYLSNVTIADDPAYSLEPILHADEVTAYLGTAALWSGRMEIARVNLSYPSINLVERDDASWNFESVLWKASRTKAAPTSAPTFTPRPRFPYIEATNGRINFKYGLEKSFFSFTDANFSLWSPAENEWRARLQARPVRTDMPVSDTGIVKAEATLQRAEMLRDSPITANVTWEHVQLGNLTRLIHGEDRGWRGALDIATLFSGTPAALHFSSAAKLHDFRRFDIAGGDAVNLNAACQGDWNLSAGLLDRTECNLPLGGGRLSVRGNVRGFHSPIYDLSIAADNLGANALLSIARHTKRDMPEDLNATGTVTGSLNISRSTRSPSVSTGSLELNGLNIRSAVLEKALAIENVAIVAGSTGTRAGRQLRPVKTSTSAPSQALLVQRFDVPLGGANPVQVDGLLDPEGFALHLKGDATLERLQQFARAFGIGAPRFALSGRASIDLFIGSKWDSVNVPQVGGTALLKDARAEVPGLAAPVEVSAALVELAGGRLTLHGATASADKISLSGSASFPRSCSPDSPCEVGFDLSSDEFNPARWNELLNPRAQNRPWYFFGRGRNGTLPPNLQATGHLSARRLTLETSSSPSAKGAPTATPSLSGSEFETSISYADGILELRNSRANLFGGIVAGDWTVDFTGSKPLCESTGIATRIRAERLAPSGKAPLGSGAMDFHYKLKMSGWDAASLAASATGEARFTWSGGALSISPDARSPLRVLFGEGRASLDAKGWSISESHWKTPSGVYQLRGNISRDSALDLEFIERDGGTWKVSGTLAEPQQGAAATARPAPSLRR